MHSSTPLDSVEPSSSAHLSQPGAGAKRSWSDSFWDHCSLVHPATGPAKQQRQLNSADAEELERPVGAAAAMSALHDPASHFGTPWVVELRQQGASPSCSDDAKVVPTAATCARASDVTARCTGEAQQARGFRSSACEHLSTTGLHGAVSKVAASSAGLPLQSALPQPQLQGRSCHWRSSEIAAADLGAPPGDSSLCPAGTLLTEGSPGNLVAPPGSRNTGSSSDTASDAGPGGCRSTRKGSRSGRAGSAGQSPWPHGNGGSEGAARVGFEGRAGTDAIVAGPSRRAANMGAPALAVTAATVQGLITGRPGGAPQRTLSHRHGAGAAKVTAGLLQGGSGGRSSVAAAAGVPGVPPPKLGVAPSLAPSEPPPPRSEVQPKSQPRPPLPTGQADDPISGQLGAALPPDVAARLKKKIRIIQPISRAWVEETLHSSGGTADTWTPGLPRCDDGEGAHARKRSGSNGTVGDLPPATTSIQTLDRAQRGVAGSVVPQDSLRSGSAASVHRAGAPGNKGAAEAVALGTAPGAAALAPRAAKAEREMVQIRPPQPLAFYGSTPAPTATALDAAGALRADASPFNVSTLGPPLLATQGLSIPAAAASDARGSDALPPRNNSTESIVQRPTGAIAGGAPLSCAVPAAAYSAGATAAAGGVIEALPFASVFLPPHTSSGAGPPAAQNVTPPIAAGAAPPPTMHLRPAQGQSGMLSQPAPASLGKVQGELTLLYQWYVVNKTVYLEQAQKQLRRVETLAAAAAAHPGGSTEASSAARAESADASRAFETALQIMRVCGTVERQCLAQPSGAVRQGPTPVALPAAGVAAAAAAPMPLLPQLPMARAAPGASAADGAAAVGGGGRPGSTATAQVPTTATLPAQVGMPLSPDAYWAQSAGAALAVAAALVGSVGSQGGGKHAPSAAATAAAAGGIGMPGRFVHPSAAQGSQPGLELASRLETMGVVGGLAPPAHLQQAARGAVLGRAGSAADLGAAPSLPPALPLVAGRASSLLPPVVPRYPPAMA